MNKTFYKLDNKIIKLPKSNVIDKDKVIVSNLTNELNNLKKEIIEIVYVLFKKQRSLKSLEEFYCNPYKENYLKVFNDNLTTGSVITGNLQIVGIWNNTKSFGPYCKLIDIVIIENDYQFIDHGSDSDSAIEYI